MCGDHFVIYANVESLCCMLQKNIKLYTNYTSIQKGIYYLQVKEIFW